MQVRFPGYIRKVFANATYQYVRKGEPLFTVYSPDLVATQQEYLLAQQNQKTLQLSTVDGVAAGASMLSNAAEQRLAPLLYVAARTDAGMDAVVRWTYGQGARELDATVSELTGSARDESELGDAHAAYDALRAFETSFYRRHLLPVGKIFSGPAIVLQKDSTTVIPPGCSAINDPAGNLILTIAMND